MNKNIQILSGLLVVQVGFAAWMLTKKETTATFTPTESLISIKTEALDKIVLEEKESKNQKTLELAKKGEQWVLSAQHDFPVSSEKVSGFIKSMAGFKKSWPVGNTDIAAKQFKVTEDAFERKLTFHQGDKSQVLFLGSSPGYKKIHTRPDKDSQTYSIAYSAYEASVNYKDWMDRSLLNLERTDVNKITLKQLSLQNSGGDFILSDLEDGKETIKSKTSGLVSTILRPEFNDLAGLKDSVNKGPEVLTLTVTKKDDSTVTFTWYRDPDEKPKSDLAAEKVGKGEESKKDYKPEDLILVVSNSPYAFKAKQTRIEDLISIVKSDFIKDKDPDSTPSEHSDLNSDEGASVEGSARNPEDSDGRSSVARSDSGSPDSVE